MTAVEWLIEQLFKQGYFDGNKPLSITNLDHLEHKAKEMEKQQIIEAVSFGDCRGRVTTYLTDEQYYNETYASKGSDEIK